MKILHIHPSMGTGGIEAMINALANQMSAENKVSVCSIFEPMDDWFFYNQLNPSISKHTLHKKKPGFSIKEILKVYSFIKKGKYDIVNIHGFFVYYILAVYLLHNKIKFFYTFHSDAAKESSKWDKRLIFLKKIALKRKWIIPITISPQSQESYRAIYHTDSILIPNGIHAPEIKWTVKNEISRLKPSDDTKIFIHVGRIDTPKNQIELCKIFKKLISDGEDIMLIIAGPIAKQDIYDELRLFFSERILYIGSIDNAREWMACCYAFVLPSIWEGLPVTLLEAMSVGCIPVCTPVGGIPSVIENGVNGFLSKTASTEDFIKSLNDVINLPSDAYKNIRQSAIKRFNSTYSIEIACTKYIDAYRQVLNKTI